MYRNNKHIYWTGFSAMRQETLFKWTQTHKHTLPGSFIYHGVGDEELKAAGQRADNKDDGGWAMLLPWKQKWSLSLSLFFRKWSSDCSDFKQEINKRKLHPSEQPLNPQTPPPCCRSAPCLLPLPLSAVKRVKSAIGLILFPQGCCLL